MAIEEGVHTSALPQHVASISHNIVFGEKKILAAAEHLCTKIIREGIAVQKIHMLSTSGTIVEFAHTQLNSSWKSVIAHTEHWTIHTTNSIHNANGYSGPVKRSYTCESDWWAKTHQ